MNSLNANDLAGVIVVVAGLLIFFLNIHNTMVCFPHERWIYLYYAVSGLAIAAAFSVAVIDKLQGGSGGVPSEFGRPAAILLTGSVIINSILHYRRGHR